MRAPLGDGRGGGCLQQQGGHGASAVAFVRVLQVVHAVPCPRRRARASRPAARLGRAPPRAAWCADRALGGGSTRKTEASRGLRLRRAAVPSARASAVKIRWGVAAGVQGAWRVGRSGTLVFARNREGRLF